MVMFHYFTYLVRVSSTVHTLHHLPAHQMVQQLPGVLLHPDGEVCPERSPGGGGRCEESDCKQRIRTFQSSKHALQQSQRLPGEDDPMTLRDKRN